MILHMNSRRTGLALPGNHDDAHRLPHAGRAGFDFVEPNKVIADQVLGFLPCAILSEFKMLLETRGETPDLQS